MALLGPTLLFIFGKSCHLHGFTKRPMTFADECTTEILTISLLYSYLMQKVSLPFTYKRLNQTQNLLVFCILICFVFVAHTSTKWVVVCYLFSTLVAQTRRPKKRWKCHNGAEIFWNSNESPFCTNTASYPSDRIITLILFVDFWKFAKIWKSLQLRNKELGFFDI